MSLTLSFIPENLLAPGQWFFILAAIFIIVYILYYFFYRHEPLLAQFSIAIVEIFKILPQIYNNPFPGSIECAPASIIAISLTSLGLILFLKNKERVPTQSIFDRFRVWIPA